MEKYARQTRYKRAGETILLLEKVDFKTRSITKATLNAVIYHKGITILICIPLIKELQNL